MKYRIGYTISRMYVDEFLEDKKACLVGGVIDVGGTKSYKAGQFNIENTGCDVKYLNIDEATNPDYLCSASSINLPDKSFDGAVFSEVLEHLEEPEKALHEISRILKENGVMLMTVPFLFKVHAAPHDYQRWTEYKLEEVILESGFNKVEILCLGGVFAVLADIAKQLIANMKTRWLQLIVGAAFIPIQYLAVEILDKKLAPSWTQEWPTHYGIVAWKVE